MKARRPAGSLPSTRCAVCRCGSRSVPKDIEKNAVFAARRDTRAKASMPMDGLAAAITTLLDEIQQALFDRAVKFRDDHTSRTDSYDEFKSIMEGRPGLRDFTVVRHRAVRSRHQDGNASDDSQHPQGLRDLARQTVHQVRQAGHRLGMVRQGVLKWRSRRPASCCIGGLPRVSKCSSRTPAVRCGPKKISAPGRIPKGQFADRRKCARSRTSANSQKRWAHRRTASLPSWDRSSSRAARSFTPSLPNQISKWRP